MEVETSSLNLEEQERHQTLTEISDDEVNLPPSDDEEDTAAAKERSSVALAISEGDQDEKEGEKPDGQVNGVMVLSLLDKIIGAVDQIQQTQTGLEARQQDMERSVTGIQGELTKLAKSHSTTSNSVNKMLEKVRKVSVNVKTVRANLEKQGGQIKRLESNENELLKRRNFKVMIYQDEVKLSSKLSVSKSLKLPELVQEGRGSTQSLKEGAEEHGEEGEEKPHLDLSSDEEELAIEETIEESRAERIKRSSLQRVQNIKSAFSKEKMALTREKMGFHKQKTNKENVEKAPKPNVKENFDKTKQNAKENFNKTKQKTKENLEKTKQKTKENLEKTRQKTKENLEKTRQNIEKKMGKLSTRMSVNPEHKEKIKTSRQKMMKSFTPDHTVYARDKTAVYKVPPFTFHVKKFREGAMEPVEIQGTEMVEVSQDLNPFQGLEDDCNEGCVDLEEEREMMNGRGEEVGMEDEEEDEEDDSHSLQEMDSEHVLVERDRDSD
ncbi:caveolae-associated protein 1b [Esox lucius]|uniref:Caveolae associated protein 1b n=1 Tax=Esox lucius TaxID=8010 RepID=A0A6Q2WU41_ESOLU|nr:caveolae-associated protein 1b [Esox lucius]XP_010899537.1 caveolae-associated protein 1b [Esox lucius]XP_010899538.1 caveolae-associated protein 1b [Esox lucius]XP_010899539.1 caveolae-associated protein 1b [Esox lucius]XP_012991168.1 caveolae-associated protein 1b [Esox lucius]